MTRLLISLFISISVCSAIAQAKEQDLRLCVPGADINLNPLRLITDGKDMAYLMLMRSLISTDQSEAGILSAYEFSPDGKTFTGKVNTPLKWQDGLSVTNAEVALSIAQQLPYRPLGSRVSILGNNRICKDREKQCVGIQLLPDNRFRITFKSDIENLMGVLREAFSTNSRHNRFWISKLGPKGKLQLLSKFPQSSDVDSFKFLVGASKVALINSPSCAKSDFTIFAETIDQKKFKSRKSPLASSTTALINTTTMNVELRKQLVSWIRNAFSNADAGSGFEFVDSFFMPGETGHTNVVWPKNPSPPREKNREFVLGYEHPIYKPILEKAIAAAPFKVRLVALPSKEKDLDGQVVASSMSDGRQIVLQDILKWTDAKSQLSNAHKTVKVLNSIAAKSSATLPVDQKMLMEFESASLSEFAFAPLARRYPVAFTRTSAPICLSWTARGELTFEAISCK